MSMIGQYWTILLVVTAVIVTVALIHYGDRFARAWAWVDHPGGRKKHKRPTPLHGGLAIFLAILPPMACLIQVDSHYLGLVVAAIVLVMVGLVDDLRPMNAKLRMLLQWLVARGVAGVLAAAAVRHQVCPNVVLNAGLARVPVQDRCVGGLIGSRIAGVLARTPVEATLLSRASR